MRGTHGDVYGSVGDDGLIPTYAGNTVRRLGSVVRRRAHPHVCGEHRWVKHMGTGHRGSSPRMRGTPARAAFTCSSRGLIPTYAGNTCGRSRVAGSSRAHPHVCGEHSIALMRSRYSSGSSPRMRGTQHCFDAFAVFVGLIPTYAGNTGYTVSAAPRLRAHPHVCGEHRVYRQRRPTAPGSSPRMRGTLSPVRVLRVLRGLIPTYAGNTSSSSFSHRSYGAHPHVCGEHR